jgi:CBS domain containing-hemolysin-like protein
LTGRDIKTAMGDDDNVKDLMTPRERLIVVREDQTVDRFEMIRLMNKNKI